ncbi:MAG: FtsK/SpoIIIE domain-containing protein [Tetrasphaera sp.]
MKLRVTLRRGASGPAVNIQVTADAMATVGDVATVLACADPLGAEGTVGAHPTLRVRDRSAHGATAVSPSASLLESGIRSGSIIEIVDSAQSDGAPSATAAVLRVVAGPDVGVEVQLPYGASDIGRSATARVRLTDPLVSKLHARVNVGDTIDVVDANSANGVIVGGVRVARTTVGSGEPVRLGDTELTISRSESSAEGQLTSTDIPFVRSPRVLAHPSSRDVELPNVPAAPDPPPFPWVAMIAPLAMGAALFALSSHRGLSLVFVAMSPMLMLGNYLAQRNQSAARHRAAVAAFTAELRSIEDELSASHATDREALERLHPPVADCLAHAHSRGELLWSRRPEHREFLQVRLGVGILPALTRPVTRVTNGLPELAEPSRDLAHRLAVLTDAPVTADLRVSGGLGLCGAASALEGAARAVVAQTVCLHSPTELVICCFTSAEGRTRWAWLEWLPHVTSPRSPTPMHLSADSGSARILMERLEEVVDQRAKTPHPTPRGQVASDKEPAAPPLPALVVIVDDPLADRSRLTRLAERGPDAGVFVVWVTPIRSDLPAACRTFLEVTDRSGAHVGHVREGTTIEPVRIETVDAESAASLARALAPVADVGAPAVDDTDLPRSVPVVSVLGAEAVDHSELVLTRWRENLSWVARDGMPLRPRERAGDLRAIVGHAGSEPFTLDLRAQGPHALVGGTTGSGKSEFLQAWVLGLAHAYSPDRVSFLFVDYKGGAAFARCVDLPHCVGLVTDLSPYLVRRALRSLRAELRYREHLLQQRGHKDLVDFERSGDPDCPPSLIIVIDEFAALVTEVPEFVDGVVDIAQRGRSLGLHLILATQRPAGVIRDNLRANTNLRIALRMADEHDSTDVLGNSLAAHFDPTIPRRGAAKTGPGRIQAFQSSYPSARTPAQPPPPAVEVIELDFGTGVHWKTPKPQKVGDSVARDIDRVVNTILAAANSGAIPPPRRPWLDPLAESYDLLKLPQRRDTEIVLGVLDDPDHQAQVVEYFRPDTDGNILVVGASGSGKSTALRSIAIASAITPRSGPVHVYALDFAGGALSLLTPMPHVGSVIDGVDEERVARLLRHLEGVIEDRSRRYSDVRASTLTEYRQILQDDSEPRLLLLVDGFATFRSEYELVPGKSGIYNQFAAVVAEGRAVGVHLAMSADRPAVVPPSVMSAFQRKVVLRQSGEDAYLHLGVPRDVLTAASGPGRGMLVDRHNELQLALLGTDYNVAAQSKLIESLSRSLERHHTLRPQPIRSLPTLIPAADVPDHVNSLPVAGMRDLDLEYQGFLVRGVQLLAGPPESGRTASVRWLAEAIHRRYPDAPLVHLSARRSTLVGQPIWRHSHSGADGLTQLLDVLRGLAGEPAPPDHPTMAVFIEYLPEFAGTVAESPLLELITMCRRNGHFLLAHGEISSWSKFTPLANECKADRAGLLLAPDQADGETLLRTPLPRCKRADFPPGRGFWIAGGKAVRLQLPLVG